MIRFWLPVSCLALLLVALLARGACAQQNPDGRLLLSKIEDPLILLLRDEEVFRELKVTPAQRKSLQQLADRLDLLVWPARNRTLEQARAAWSDATTQARSEAANLLDSRQQERLNQILYWLQGTAAIGRDDVADKLKFTNAQRQSIAEILDKTADSLRELQEQAANGEPLKPIESKIRTLKQNELRQINRLLNDSQRVGAVQMLGKTLDVTKLGRITFAAPALIADDEDWLDPAHARTQLPGHVAAVHFFANGCINCIRNYEHYNNWEADFRDKGLLIIGIHTPETEGEKDRDRLREKVKEAGFAFPILVDNQLANWNAWGNSMWPSVYLIDRRGRIRYWWYGELNWQGSEGEAQLRRRIEELLAESAE
ncbi:MAG: redoxin domain-containing protein [Planctomycetaceae bacterium]|nr:redoxin domain-containing protein [Planctomycetaceae bacterium]